MKESRAEIMESLNKVCLEKILFLMSVDSAAYEKIIDDAVKERIPFDFSFGLEFEGLKLEEEEEDIENFINSVAYKIRNAGTLAWIRNTPKEVAESLINAIHIAGHCKITLPNGESFDEWKLVREWERVHKETIATVCLEGERLFTEKKESEEMKDLWGKKTIRDYRKAAGLAQPEFSKMFEIPLNTVKKWDAGIATPPAWAEKLIIEKLEKITKST